MAPCRTAVGKKWYDGRSHPHVPHAPAPALQAMTLHSTDDASSIFKDGKLKPGIYNIQNVQTENYVDIEVHTREVCCRPAKDLGVGRGLVCRPPSFKIRV